MITILAKAADPRLDTKGQTSIVTHKLLCCACVKAKVNTKISSARSTFTQNNVIYALNCVQLVYISGSISGSKVFVRISKSDGNTHSQMPNLLLNSKCIHYTLPPLRSGLTPGPCHEQRANAELTSNNRRSGEAVYFRYRGDDTASLSPV